MELDAIVRWCAQGPRHVVLTGGEPLLFGGMLELARRLRADDRHHVTFETAGTVAPAGLQCDLVSISPKLAHATPDDPVWGPKHAARRWQPAVVRRLMEHPWQLKLVVRAHDPVHLRADVREAVAMVEALDVPAAARDRVMLMPECVDPARLSADYAALVPVCSEHGFSLGPRLHIQIFGHVPGT